MKRSAALGLGAMISVAACKNKIQGTKQNEAAPVQQAPLFAAPQPVASASPVAEVRTVEKAPAATAKSRILASYDASLGSRLAQKTKNAAAGGSLGLCFGYVGRAISEIWPSGFHDSGDCSSTDLNCRSYARSFAEHWKSSVHGGTMHLKAALLKDNVNGENHDDGLSISEAPVGSILVWRKCSSNPAGHIAVVTRKGSEAASDFLHGIDVCARENLIGILVPVK